MAVHLGARGRGPLEKFDFVPPAVPNGVGGQCAGRLYRSDSSRARPAGTRGARARAAARPGPRDAAAPAATSGFVSDPRLFE